jgi:hypothetical protein
MFLGMSIIFKANWKGVRRRGPVMQAGVAHFYWAWTSNVDSNAVLLTGIVRELILTRSNSHRDVHSTINGHHLRISSRRPVFESLCLPIVSRHCVVCNLYVMLVCFVSIYAAQWIPTHLQYLASRSLDWQGALLWPATWLEDNHALWLNCSESWQCISHRFRSLYHRVVASSQAFQIPLL